MGRWERLGGPAVQLQHHCMDGVGGITAWLFDTTQIFALGSFGRSGGVPDIQGDRRLHLHLFRAVLQRGLNCFMMCRVRLFHRGLRSFHSWGAEVRRMRVQGLTNFFSWLGTR